jgi:hypothetical protein
VTFLFPSSVECTGCHAEFSPEEMGQRKDGRMNTRCPDCRAKQASLGGKVGHVKAREPHRDMKALRVVERFVGFRWKRWISPEGRAAQDAFLERTGMTFEDLWTYRMKTLAGRADRCAAIALRQRERQPQLEQAA